MKSSGLKVMACFLLEVIKKVMAYLINSRERFMGKAVRRLNRIKDNSLLHRCMEISRIIINIRISQKIHKIKGSSLKCKLFCGFNKFIGKTTSILAVSNSIHLRIMSSSLIIIVITNLYPLQLGKRDSNSSLKIPSSIVFWVPALWTP